METLSSFDDLSLLKSRHWYSFLPSTSNRPSARTGHSIVQHPNASILYCVGGANNEGLSQSNHVLDLTKMEWNEMCTIGFQPRYEHSVFAYKQEEQLSIYVFGGANTSRNKNDVQVYNANCQLWETLNVIGQKPSGRTQHSCTVCDGLQVVFGGGKIGTEPVSDSSVYTFNPTTLEWNLVQMSGTTPCCRQGHSMTAVGSKVYVFGGMNGDTIFDDLYIMDMKRKEWSLLNPSGNKPSARAAHSIVSIGEVLYLFGGLGKEGALNDLYCFHPENKNWTKIITETILPPPRLNFAMCVIAVNPALLHSQKNSLVNDEDAANIDEESSLQSVNRPIIMIHGGVNSSCCILDDCYVFYL